MARCRVVKPEFLLDERLVGLSLEARLYIVGAATLADRDGVLENRPLRIKLATMPHDASEPASIIQSLLLMGVFSISEDDNYLKIEPWEDWFRPFNNEPKYQLNQSFICGTLIEQRQAYPTLTPSLVQASSKDKDKLKDKEKKKERLPEYSEDVRTVVNACFDIWPRVQRDGKPIRVDTSQLAVRVDLILGSVDITPANLVLAAKKYLESEKLAIKAPQYFFGKQEDQAPNAANWKDYARMVYHQARSVETP